MTGLWVALSLRQAAAEVRSVLETWFPELVVAEWDLSSMRRAEEALKDPVVAAADILFQVAYSESEFPTEVHIDRFPGPQEEAAVQPIMLELARRFADVFDCRTMCDGSEYGDGESPYWIILWDGGRSDLARHSDTEAGDQCGGAVKIVREIALPPFGLDASGQPT